MTVNNAFMRKLVSDELRDTLFFATGQRPVKERGKDVIILTVEGFAEVKIHSHKRIYVNGDMCRHSPEAKYAIQELIV